MVGETRVLDHLPFHDEQDVEEHGLPPRLPQKLQRIFGEPLRDGVGQTSRRRDCRKENFKMGFTSASWRLAGQDGDQ